MFTHKLYVMVHLAGLLMAFLAVASLAYHGMQGTKENPPDKKLIMLFHGLGMLLALVGGFGLLARIGGSLVGWVHGKLGLWVVLGVLPILLRKRPELSKAIWCSLPLLLVLGAYLAGGPRPLLMP